MLGLTQQRSPRQIVPDLYRLFGPQTMGPHGWSVSASPSGKER